ncbi:hypothetical protein N656DRAFT_849318 [Canariomyces notabilis]|uniref:Uncharacterized protein n=1 Tax=Canariomyces notabilis TaxID=2074819 RepID=A0AAN6T7H7_9PEZI|nr:hypothetical protein N656DRAFT_849318 [Canariomyces arenarius]
MGWNKDGTANVAAAQANVLVDMSHDSYLVEQQADKEAKDNEDRRPLYHTAAAGHTATVQYLIM